MSPLPLSEETYKTYQVSPSRRTRTVDWLARGLQMGGCRIIVPPAYNVAPFKIVFDTPEGERIGAIFYLFTISCVQTRNRPVDECRFQIKYGRKDGLLHELWQDPTSLYTTVFLGIDPATGCWVAADPVLHSPTLMYISLEFKQRHLDAARETGWHVWERDSTIDTDEPTEVLVGGRPERLVDLVKLERAAKGLDQGHRELLATARLADAMRHPRGELVKALTPVPVEPQRLHQIAREFGMSPDEILSLIAEAPRLKMAVRGWVAETHLQRVLAQIPAVSDCERLNVEGKPDIRLSYHGRGPIYVECKNVLRETTKNGLPRVDFQRTRTSQGDRCSRYYRPDEFNILAACLHAITERWEFMYRLPKAMAPHKACAGRLSNLVRVDDQWSDAERVLASAVGELS